MKDKDPRFAIAFGQCVRALRERAGIAQEALGLASGIDRAYMGKLERGEHNPTIQMVYRLLPVFKLTFADFAVEYEKVLRRVRREKKDNGAL